MGRSMLARWARIWCMRPGATRKCQVKQPEDPTRHRVGWTCSIENVPLSTNLYIFWVYAIILYRFMDHINLQGLLCQEMSMLQVLPLPVRGCTESSINSDEPGGWKSAEFQHDFCIPWPALTRKALDNAIVSNSFPAKGSNFSPWHGCVIVNIQGELAHVNYRL